ncbi:hypothetical protein D9M72_433280 [compost metagenome]
MVGPVAHVRLPVGDLALQRAAHELAEGDVGTVMVVAVAHDEIHRHVERPFDIVGKAEIRTEGGGQQAGALVVGVAPDIAAPGEQPVRLAVGKGRARKQRRRKRLQLQGHLHLAAHVLFGGKVEIHLDRAGAVHHVEAPGADLGHVAAHDAIARFRHARCLGEGPLRAAADAEETDAERFGDFAQNRQMLVRFLAGLVQVFERRSGKLELAARLQRDRAIARLLGKADDVALVDDRFPAALCGHSIQKRLDAGLAEIGDGAVVRLKEGELFVLRADPEPLLRFRTFCQIGGQVSDRGYRRLVGGISGHERLLLFGRLPLDSGS